MRKCHENFVRNVWKKYWKVRIHYVVPSHLTKLMFFNLVLILHFSKSVKAHDAFWRVVIHFSSTYLTCINLGYFFLFQHWLTYTAVYRPVQANLLFLFSNRVYISLQCMKYMVYEIIMRSTFGFSPFFHLLFLGVFFVFNSHTYTKCKS